MDATLRDKAAELQEHCMDISTPQELSEIMRLMSKSMIERMLQAEMDVHLSPNFFFWVSRISLPRQQLRSF